MEGCPLIGIDRQGFRGSEVNLVKITTDGVVA